MQIDVNQLMSALKQMDLAGEITYSTKPIIDAIELIKRMTETGLGFEETNETLRSVYEFELAPGGRLGSISSQYGALVGEASAVNQGKFDLASGKALMYLGDIVNIQPVLKAAYDIALGLLWLEDGSALILAKETFDRAGYHYELREYIERDVKGVYAIVSSKHESENEKTNKLPPLDFSKIEDQNTYLKAREFDFAILCTKYLPPNGILLDPCTNNFRFMPDREAQVITLDKYSERICRLMDKIADIEVTLAACELFFAMPKAIPQSKECQVLLDLVKQLVTGINDLGKHTLDIYDKFKKGGDEVPYCFMRKIKAFEEVSGFGLQDLNKDEPIKTGLHLRLNYKIMFTALVEYKKVFMRGFGLFDY